MMDVMNVCIHVLKIVNIVNMEYVRNVKDNFIYLIIDAMKQGNYNLIVHYNVNYAIKIFVWNATTNTY